MFIVSFVVLLLLTCVLFGKWQISVGIQVAESNADRNRRIEKFAFLQKK